MTRYTSSLARFCAAACGLLAATQLTVLAASVSFTTPGGPYSFTVPAGVSSINVEASGGGGNDYSGAIVTRGALVSATLPVTPGSTLYVYVGGNGGSGQPYRGGFNGGGNGGGSGFSTGGGGGASDIRTVTNDLSSRIIVAGGGGGSSFFAGGGDAGANGSAYIGTVAGAGGTNAGGVGGVFFTFIGTDGAFGQGGVGATDANGGRYGGGGGGGWYGGGGGNNYGGGGGGSSYVIPAATSVSNSLSALSATPKVTIRYVTPPVLVAAKRLNNGDFQFSFTNEPATTFTVLTSTNLLAPIAQWTALGSATETSTGSYQFTDSNPSAAGARYYRVKN